MESLRKTSFKTSRGITYTYYHHPGDTAKPTILLLHGFPDDAHEWEYIDKPTDVDAFTITFMVADLAEILDHENISKVIPVGHDWGSFMAQNVTWHYPDRVVGLILLSVAYSPPSSPMPPNMEQFLALTQDSTGQPRLSYWELFTAPDAEQLILSHLESWWCVLHGAPKHWMRELFCRRGAMRKFLENDERVPLKSYAENAALKERHLGRWKRDGLKSQLNFYNATVANIQYEASQKLDPAVYKLNKPLLFIGSDDDAVCLTEYIKRPIQQGLLADYSVKELEAGHWIPFEKPAEIGGLMVEFLNEKFA